MSFTDEEFVSWAVAHHARHPFARLPKPEGPQLVFWRTLKKALEVRGVRDLKLLTAASERLFREPPKRAGDHNETLVNFYLEAARAAGLPGAGAADDTREAAEAASRDCERCGGTGLATVYRRAPEGPLCNHCRQPVDADLVCRRCRPSARPVPASVSAHCGCRMGRWVRRRQLLTCREAHDRTPDLVDVLEGRSKCWRHDPPEAPVGVAALARELTPAGMVRALVERARAERPAAGPSPSRRPLRPLPLPPAAAIVRDATLHRDPVLRREAEGRPAVPPEPRPGDAPSDQRGPDPCPF